MGDRWTDRLSDHIDGELGAAEERELSAHLAECPECTSTLAELRQVVRTLAALPDAPPEKDLWAGIESRLPGAPSAETPVIVLAQRRRRFSFTMPQLAAAGITLVAASSMVVWLVVSRPGSSAAPGAVATSAAPAPVSGVPQAATAPAVTPGAGAPAPVSRLAANPAVPARVEGGSRTERVQRERTPAAAARFVRAGSADLRSPADRQYDAAVADLQRVLRRERSRLQPETVTAVEKSLRDIDRAIAEARRALKRDPADPYLNDHLAESMRLKLELLRQTAALAQS